MNRKALTGIIIAAIAIPVGVYTISPLFINTTVNEPIPGSATALEEFQKFMAMTEQERMEKGKQMTEEEKDLVMGGAAQTDSGVNESMAGGVREVSLAGNFVGVNDGLHNAEGTAKVITLQDGSRILRLENFRATNGPDLYVYLATDKGASDFVSLGRLKGNIGNQNYGIPEGTDLSRYDTALIWCRAFSVLFGSAELRQ